MVKLRKMTVQIWQLQDQIWLVRGPVPRVGSEDGFTKSCLSTTHIAKLF